MIEGKKFLPFNDKYFLPTVFYRSEDVDDGMVASKTCSATGSEIILVAASPFFGDEKYVAMVDAIKTDLFSSFSNFLCFTDFGWLIKADLPCMIYLYFYNTVCKTLHEHSSFAQPNISNLPLSIQIAESGIFPAFFLLIYCK